MPENDTLPPAALSGVTSKPRDPAFDIARGVGIVSVLVHHWTGNAARLYTQPKSLNWWILSLTNRMTTYTVPLFLLISCILAAQSLTRQVEKSKDGRVDPIKFYKARLPGVIYPYLVWTGIFWLLTLIANPDARHLQHGIPMFFTHPMARLNDLLWGKAAFHLYFLVALIQTLLFMPVLFWKPFRGFLARQAKFDNIMALVFTWLILQSGIQALQHYLLRLPYPASTFLWYSSAWWTAVWWGIFVYQDWSRVFNRSFQFVLVLAALSLITNINLAVQDLGGLDVNNWPIPSWFASNFQLAGYCCLIGISVIFLCWTLSMSAPNSRAAVTLQWLGKNSLQIYLIHPIILDLLGKPKILKLLAATPAGPLLELALMTGVTLAIVMLLKLVKVEKLFFGRAT